MSIQFKPKRVTEKSYDFSAQTYIKYVKENNDILQNVWIEQLNALDSNLALQGEQ
jgi:hypothetical protein